jgi:hypothetical protein
VESIDETFHGLCRSASAEDLRRRGMSRDSLLNSSESSATASPLLTNARRGPGAGKESASATSSVRQGFAGHGLAEWVERSLEDQDPTHQRYTTPCNVAPWWLAVGTAPYLGKGLCSGS